MYHQKLAGLEAFGRAAGAYGQMHCISLILQGLRDGWIPDDQKIKYYDILRRLFMFFYETYLDQEQGFLDIRDDERTAYVHHTTRMANFDAARYLCQWSRLAKTIQMPSGAPKVEPARTSGRFVIFDKSNRKEQGLFLYRDAESGLHLQVPLVSSGSTLTSDSLAFPHCPGVFDWPNNAYLDEIIHVYLAENLTPDPLPADQDEYLERRLFPFAEALAMAQDDRITCGLTKLAILWTAVARAAPRAA